MTISITRVLGHNQHLGFDSNLHRQDGLDGAFAPFRPQRLFGKYGTTGAILLEIGEGLQAGAITYSHPSPDMSTTPVFLSANKPLVVSFSASGQATFRVETSSTGYSPWSGVDSLELPGSVTEVRSYVSDVSCFVRFSAQAIHACSSVVVLSQVRNPALTASPADRPQRLLPAQFPL